MRFSLAAKTLVLVVTATLVGCGGGSKSTPTPPASPSLTSITISPIGPAVTVNNSVALKAMGTFSDKSTQDVTATATWSSDQSGVATVSSGNVTGVAVGVATITAASGSVKASTAVNVTNMKLSNTTLKGQYAFFISAIDSRGQAFIVGTLTADGKGNITGGTADINSATGVTTNSIVAPLNNAYTIWPDGRGTATLNINGQTFDIAFIVSQDGSRGKMISFDNNPSYGTFEQQDTAVENDPLSGTFAFAFNGLDQSAESMATIGVFDASSTSSGNGQRDVNASGVTPGNHPITVTLAAPSNSRGTAVIAGSNFSSNYAFYVVNSGKALFIQTDTGVATVLGGIAEQQMSAAPTLALPNSYALLLDHAATANNGTWQKVAQLNFDVSGNITGGFEDNDRNNIAGPIISSGSSLTMSGGNGRGTITNIVSTSTSPVTHGGIIYVVDTSHFLMMSTDSGDPLPGVGVGEVMAGAIADGPFGFTATELGETNLLELGQIVVSGSGANLSGIAYLNNNGKLSAVAFTAALPQPSGRPFIASVNGIFGHGVTLYVTSPNRALLRGADPDLDGSLDAQ